MPDVNAPDPTRWTEAMLAALEPSEHDFQEFKSTPFLAEGKVIVADFVANLSRQVSAFANGGGGRLFFGIDDAGQVDGGVRMDLKGGGTRSWLEDVIPGCVDPPLRRFNVFEIPYPGEDVETRIEPGCAVYVVEIPPSDDAPHQSLDYRYYLRIAGKSRPMGHVHIPDVLQRTRHPRVDITRVGPYGRPERVESDPRGPKQHLGFQAFLTNHGRHLAKHVGVELILPRPMINGQVRGRILAAPGVTLTQRPGTLLFFRHHPYPLFPEQEIAFLRFWVALHAGNAETVRAGDAKIEWRVFADDAPPRHGGTPFRRFAVVRRALKWLDGQARKR